MEDRPSRTLRKSLRTLRLKNLSANNYLELKLNQSLLNLVTDVSVERK
jgi:hypothetical protein